MKTPMQTLLSDIKDTQPNLFKKLEKHFELDSFYLEAEKQMVIDAVNDTDIENVRQANYYIKFIAEKSGNKNIIDNFCNHTGKEGEQYFNTKYGSK